MMNTDRLEFPMNRLLLIALALGLSACASNKPYTCPLNGHHGCKSMQEIYDAARKAPRKMNHEHVLDAAQRGGSVASVPPYDGYRYTEPGEVGQPVFKQPRVYRVWLAPYVDADGNLRSGEYTYFSTPGEWAYGTTRETGVAGDATFAPARPDQLGFTPIEKSSRSRQSPPRPGDSAPTPPAVTTSDGITQPSQTFTQP